MNTDKIRTTSAAVLGYLDSMSINNSLTADLRAALAELDAAPPSPVFLAVYIACTNDTNGNPRRGWYVSRLDGQPMLENAPTGRKGETAPAWTCWVEEGYGGRQSLLRAIGGTFEPGEVTTCAYNARVSATVHETGRINVTPGEYRDARKLPTVRA